MSLERNKMKLLRKPRTAIQKRTAFGRHLRVVRTEEIDGRVYGISLHATKGYRHRRVFDASVRRKLIGL